MKQYHVGYVAITGRPNVGKSTLINQIVKRKVAIISYKPQTTRNKINALYNDENSSIMFIDTPGYHKRINKFDDHLNAQVKSTYKTVDCVLLLIDPTKPLTDEDFTVINLIKDFKVNSIILVLTKSDITKKYNDSVIDEIKKHIDINDIINVSALKNTNIKELIGLIKTKLPTNDKPLDKIDDDDNFIISEIIREQIIFNTQKEVPYSTFVSVENKKYENDLFTIDATIIVEKESQKPIIIGKGGQMIKKIGTQARKELLNIYDCKINLKLFVKVEKEWRNNDRFAYNN
jgi:GTP-binding protein Era